MNSSLAAVKLIKRKEQSTSKSGSKKKSIKWKCLSNNCATWNAKIISREHLLHAWALEKRVSTWHVLRNFPFSYGTWNVLAILLNLRSDIVTTSLWFWNYHTMQGVIVAVHGNELWSPPGMSSFVSTYVTHYFNSYNSARLKFFHLFFFLKHLSFHT